MIPNRFIHDGSNNSYLVNGIINIHTFLYKLDQTLYDLYKLDQTLELHSFQDKGSNIW